MNAKLIRFINILVLMLTVTGLSFSIIQAQDNDVTAFVNVNVVPMDSEQVLEAQTVIVENGLITAISGVDEIEVPDGAEIIDGNGAYLMPGLADMHMHIQYLKNYNDPKQLLFFLAQGTTTIRSLGTPPGANSWREQVKTGELVGPTIYTMGRSFAGNNNNMFGLLPYMLLLTTARILVPVLLGVIVFIIIALAAKPLRTRRNALIIFVVALTIGLILELTKTPPFQIVIDFVGESPQAFVADNVSQAMAELQRQQEEWDVDGVKSYDGQEEEVYFALMEEAQARNMYVSGHLLNQVPLNLQLTSGIDEIAHIDEFLSHHWIGYNLGINPDPAYAETFSFPVDFDAIPQTTSFVVENNVAVVSNMSADEVMVRLIADTEGTLAGAEYAEFRPDLAEGWSQGGRHLTIFANALEQRRDVEMPFYMTLIKAIHDEGALILIGTDSGGFVPEGSVPGHIHREMELLVESGFSNYEALAAGTKNAGIIVNRMGRDGNFGTVEIGQRADLILIENNPLENVSNTRNRIGVMTRGRWYLQSELDEMLEAVVASF